MVNIIGAGLAGSILKRHLDQLKIDNRIIDCDREWRSSNKSENLFSRTWAKSLGDDVVQSGVSMLESMVEIKSIPFLTASGKINDTLHVPVSSILINDYLFDEIIDLCFDGCRGKSGVFYKGINVVCTGWWARKLIDQAKGKMIGLTGQGIFFDGSLPNDMSPIMNFVSPYVHQKLFQFDIERFWYGDSTCIHYWNYVQKQGFYQMRCMNRAAKLLGDNLPPKYNMVVGIRPWVRGHKGYLDLDSQVNVIINTGGWKCGLIIYADHARKIGEHLIKLLNK